MGTGLTGKGDHQSGSKQAGAPQTSTNGKKPSPAAKGTKDDRDGKDDKKAGPTTTPATNQVVGPQTSPAPAATPTSTTGATAPSTHRVKTSPTP
jgi:hypothetical protein